MAGWCGVPVSVRVSVVMPATSGTSRTARHAAKPATAKLRPAGRRGFFHAPRNFPSSPHREPQVWIAGGGGYRRYLADCICGGVDAFPARLLAPLVSAGRFDRAAAELKLDGWRYRLFTNPKQMGTKAQTPVQEHGASRLRQALYADQTGWLPDQLLERNDRAAAAASLDARMPFLDHRVAEYVSALPDGQRVRGLTTKWILREAGRRLIPQPLARLRKGGWRIDAGGWLRNELRELTLEHLQSASSVTRRYYDPAALDRVLEEHLKGKKNHETLLWTLLNLEIWHRTYSPG